MSSDHDAAIVAFRGPSFQWMAINGDETHSKSLRVGADNSIKSVDFVLP